MGLSQAQKTMFEKARRLSAGRLGVALDDGACRALVVLAAQDLGIGLTSHCGSVAELYEADPIVSLSLPGEVAPLSLFAELCNAGFQDVDTYFACLAALHKARLKYSRILEAQPIATLDQVGPRSLLQYGGKSTTWLPQFLVWRKFIFDLDNRAAQESGYLFEPILVAAIGGAAYSARKSPVRRRGRDGGRQVDAIKDNFAYEFKLRMTIAASGQGRWAEELAFPGDAKGSGFTPILIVLDPTESPKLLELTAAFEAAGGEVFVGSAAWEHLEAQSGTTMGRFLEKYVRAPLEQLLQESPVEGALLDLHLSLTNSIFRATIGNDTVTLASRTGVDPELADDECGDDLDDIEDVLPGL